MALFWQYRLYDLLLSFPLFHSPHLIYRNPFHGDVNGRAGPDQGFEPFA